MNIRCPQCQTVFRVDPTRIPEGGAKAKCARCGAKFVVRPPTGGRDPSGMSTSVPAPAPPRPVAPAPPPAYPRSSQPSGHAPSPAATGAAAAVAERSARPAVSPGGGKDPNARAERLARALVSDIVAYHPERREKSLSDGTLRTEFRDEIMKSWEEYVAQVGSPMAKSTPYFREALNKILAKGRQIF
jgi:predicted Zn finger-like uncharacterized protein